ncbi:hypothetical protein HpBGD65_00150 [Helicobacter pylori]
MVLYLARTKATNFQRVILMDAKRHAKQNNNATKLNIIKSASKINTLLVTPYCPALLYWHNLSVLYKAKIASA